MKILVVAAHPDDETLGCGGTILKLKKDKHDLFWLIVTNVLTEGGFTLDYFKRRQREIDAVSKRYGFKDVVKLNLCATKLDTYPLVDIITRSSKVIKDIKPDSVFIPNGNDAHSDHRIVFDAFSGCIKSFRYPYIKNVFMYETLSETEFSQSPSEKVFSPNAYCDISGYMDKKIEIMKLYSGELGKHPFPRSKKNILALGTFRGAMIGAKFAEAFSVLKMVI